MNLNFRVVKLNEESRTFNRLKSVYDRISKPRDKFTNEFIIVGEEDENYKALQLNETGLNLIGDFKLDFISLTIPKKDFWWDGTLYTVFDIPKERLNVDLIDNIIRLNS
ncbi:Uncharacterised protein [uncultured Clostridium sp.]|uniref:hypothetical protein n=1 Tax=uncultured Clostridium sp. TaxID=59620 RepID=UPI0008204EE5|nr:hypothetical protein [uncultured Clostridium sp.]SCJ08934.1 Uncharacterised protein [uncultured Clostridium sp.]